MVPGQGFVTVETPSDSGHEPTPLLALGLRYVEQLIIRPGQRARYRAQLKALAFLRLPSPTVPGAFYLPFGRNVEDVTPEDVRLLCRPRGDGPTLDLTSRFDTAERPPLVCPVRRPRRHQGGLSSSGDAPQQ
jgi:hypothetical protein